MKRVIDKSYMCVLAIFFALFMILISFEAHENIPLYAISLMLGAVVVAIIPFFTNKCKKISARRWYLISIICASSYLFLQGLFILIFNYGNPDSINWLKLTSVWILRIALAASIASVIYLLVYCFKDFFKKNYVVQKFDLYAFTMLLNMIFYLIIIFITFGYSGFNITEGLNPVTFENIYVITLGSYNIIRNAILIASGVYILLYITIQILLYYLFEVKEENNQMFK